MRIIDAQCGVLDQTIGVILGRGDEVQQTLGRGYKVPNTLFKISVWHNELKMRLSEYSGGHSTLKLKTRLTELILGICCRVSLSFETYSYSYISSHEHIEFVKRISYWAKWMLILSIFQVQIKMHDHLVNFLRALCIKLLHHLVNFILFLFFWEMKLQLNFTTFDLSGNVESLTQDFSILPLVFQDVIQCDALGSQLIFWEDDARWHHTRISGF